MIRGLGLGLSSRLFVVHPSCHVMHVDCENCIDSRA